MPLTFPKIQRRGSSDSSPVQQGPTGTSVSSRYNDPDFVDSDVTPDDLENKPPAPPQDEQKWVEYVKDKFHEARTSARRQEMERRVLQSLCMCGDDAGQWLVWQNGGSPGVGGSYTDIRRDPSDLGRYVTDPQIMPILDRVASLATASSPDADFTGETTAQIDQDAAEEARGIALAWEEDFDLPAHLLDAVDIVLRTSTLWAYAYWNDKKAGLMPETGADGQAAGAKSGTPGGVDVDLIPWYDGFPDSQTRDAKKLRGFTVARLLPLTELVLRYGKVAEGVQPDAPGETLSYFQSRYAYLAGQFDFKPDDNPQTRRTHVVVYERMEPKTPRYKAGLRLVVAGDRLLFKDENPGWDALPLIPLTYHRADGTPWGMNAVSPLAGLQRAINRAWTDALDVLDRQKLYLTVWDGAELEPDAYSRTQSSQHTQRDIIEIRVKPGAQPPQFQLPPAPQDAYLNLVERLLDHMKAISGIRDAISGNAPASDSGVKVELLQQAAKAQLALFTQGIESFVTGLMQTVVDLYAANAKSTQLIALSGEGDEAAKGREAKALKNLTSGGKVRVRVTPGSAMPKLPQSQDDDLNQMVQNGLFQPENLPETMAVLEAKSWSGSSPLIDNLKELMEFRLKQQQQQQAMEQANQPNPQAVAQMQAQAQQQQQQAQQSHEAEMQAMQDHQAGIDHQNAVELQAIKDHAASELSRQNHEQAMALAKYQSTLPKVSLSGPMGPTAIESAEKEAGLESDTAAEAEQAQQAEADKAQMSQETTLKTAQMKASQQKTTPKGK